MIYSKKMKDANESKIFFSEKVEKKANKWFDEISFKSRLYDN